MQNKLSSQLRQLCVFAKLGFQELLYEKSHLLISAFVFFLIVIGYLLSQLTYIEKSQLMLHFMVAMIHLMLIGFAVFMTTKLIKNDGICGYRDYYLTHSISRPMYLMGRFFGMALFLFFLTVVFFCLLAGVVFFQGVEISFYFITQLVGFVFIESLVLASLSVFLSLHLKSLPSVVCGLMFFLIGHMKVTSGGGDSYSIFSFLVPSLEVFNLKNFLFYDVIVSTEVLLWTLCYGLVWVMLFMMLSVLTFWNMDLERA